MAAINGDAWKHPELPEIRTLEPTMMSVNMIYDPGPPAEASPWAFDQGDKFRIIEPSSCSVGMTYDPANRGRE